MANNPRKPIIRRGLQVNPPPGYNGRLDAGYWGPSAKATMVESQIPERIIKANKDSLGMGVAAQIWVAPVMNLEHLPTCGCVKATNQSADVRCAKCHGLKRIPGYVKWGYDTHFFSAVAIGLTASPDAGYTIPPEIVKNTATSLHTLQLATGVLSASFQTHDFGVDNPFAKDWELNTLVYNRSPGNAHNVEWSLDRGTTWMSGKFSELSLFHGTIRFRVTLSRTSANDHSPQFEILRFRHPCQNQPFIKIARPMGTRKRKREEFGKTEDESGLNYWTVPMDEGTSAKILGQKVYDKVWLPDNFIFEILEGTFAGDRYAVVSYKRSEHIGIMTSQSFDVRRVQPDEIGGILW